MKRSAKRFVLTMDYPSACQASVVARQGKRIVGRGKGSRRVVVKFSKRVSRGTLKLTVRVGATTLKQTVMVR